MPQYRSLIAVAAAALLGASVSAQAGTLYDNLGGNPGGYYQANSGFDGPMLGASFSTGGSAAVLNDIKLMLMYDDQNAQGTFTVAVYKDQGDNDFSNAHDAGAILTVGTFTDPTSDTPTVWDFGSLSASLDPNSRYWVGLIAGSDDSGSDGDTSVAWQLADNPDSGVGASGESQFTADFGTDTNQNQGTAFEMAVTTANPAPEPATLSILGLGLAAMGLARRRRGN